MGQVCTISTVIINSLLYWGGKVLVATCCFNHRQNKCMWTPHYVMVGSSSAGTGGGGVPPVDYLVSSVLPADNEYSGANTFWQRPLIASKTVVWNGVITDQKSNKLTAVVLVIPEHAELGCVQWLLFPIVLLSWQVNTMLYYFTSSDFWSTVKWNILDFSTSSCLSFKQQSDLNRKSNNEKAYTFLVEKSHHNDTGNDTTGNTLISYLWPITACTHYRLSWENWYSKATAQLIKAWVVHPCFRK